MTTTNATSTAWPLTEKPAWKALGEHYRKIRHDSSTNSLIRRYRWFKGGQS